MKSLRTKTAAVILTGTLAFAGAACADGDAEDTVEGEIEEGAEDVEEGAEEAEEEAEDAAEEGADEMSEGASEMEQEMDEEAEDEG